jgi:hypothetical protein
VDGTKEVPANADGDAAGDGSTSETAGPVAGSAGMPLYPGRPYCSCSGAEYGNCSDVELGSSSGAEVDVRASTAARRTEMSPICSCMPWIAETRAARVSLSVGRFGTCGAKAEVPRAAVVAGGADGMMGSAGAEEASVVAGTPEVGSDADMVSDTKVLALRDRRL